MSYPTLEQYNEKFQSPQLALTDPELKQGSVATTGLGLPLALCGGFALTYTIKSGSKKHAVRCFHKQSNALEERYVSISNRLKILRSPYFVDFEFQPQGIRVAGKSFPIVKMAWASGTTLGEFLEQNYRSPSNLLNLRASLRSLTKYLESQGMAHGDIQPGNVMVADAGKKLQLIDYDGIFVEELRALGSSELGHRNFQHPKRASSSWDGSLDRFSFICLDLAIRALASHPELWSKTNSDGDSILFKANDFTDPNQSSIFGDLVGRKDFAEDAKSFAAICKSAFEKTPTLEDFLAKRNIPQVSITIAEPSEAVAAQYLSAFPILDATNYSHCLSFVGDKVELIGQIVEVRQDKTRHGKPYVFINFGPWKGHIVKINIWSEGLDALTTRPTDSWVKKWISVTGLMEPVYVNRKYKYSHLSISITQGSQIHQITEKEAKFRLAGSSTRSKNSDDKRKNLKRQESLKKDENSDRTDSPKTANPSSRDSTTDRRHSNEDVLKNMLEMLDSQSAPQPTTAPQKSSASYQSARSKPASSSRKCFIATEIYGANAPQTDTLRRWRDQALLPHYWGRAFVSTYYAISPRLVPVVNRYEWIRASVKLVLDKIVTVVATASNDDR